MSYQDWLELFAYGILIGVTLLVIIDALAEFNIKVPLRLKWSIAWYILRYIVWGFAITLAIDVIRR